MKRSGIKRGKPMRRTGFRRRRSSERADRRLEQNFGALAEHVRAVSCCACGAPPRSDPAHVKSRGSGGHAFLDNGHGNIIPFCRTCHDLQGAKGWSAVPWMVGAMPDPHSAKRSRERAEMLAENIGREFRATQTPLHGCGTRLEQGDDKDWSCPTCDAEYFDQEL